MKINELLVKNKLVHLLDVRVVKKRIFYFYNYPLVMNLHRIYKISLEVYPYDNHFPIHL